MFRDIWQTLERFLHSLGGMCLFLLRLLQYTPEVVIRRFRLVVYQVYNAGALSLVVIMISGLFVGGVLGLLAHSSLEQSMPKIRRAFLPAWDWSRASGPCSPRCCLPGARARR